VHCSRERRKAGQISAGSSRSGRPEPQLDLQFVGWLPFDVLWSYWTPWTLTQPATLAGKDETVSPYQIMLCFK
jgi:hypothetical protein